MDIDTTQLATDTLDNTRDQRAIAALVSATARAVQAEDAETAARLALEAVTIQAKEDGYTLNPSSLLFAAGQLLGNLIPENA